MFSVLCFQYYISVLHVYIPYILMIVLID